MSPTAFRVATLVSVLLSFVSAMVDDWFPQLLPPGLAQASVGPSPFDGMALGWVLLLTLGFCAVSLACLIGFLQFRPWARLGCVLITLLPQVAAPWFGATVMSSVAYSLASIGSWLWGGVLFLAFFSPLSQRFQRAA